MDEGGNSPWAVRSVVVLFRPKLTPEFSKTMPEIAEVLLILDANYYECLQPSAWALSLHKGLDRFMVKIVALVQENGGLAA